MSENDNIEVTALIVESRPRLFKTKFDRAVADFQDQGYFVEYTFAVDNIGMYVALITGRHKENWTDMVLE